jgi:hypothetical protein
MSMKQPHRPDIGIMGVRPYSRHNHLTGVFVTICGRLLSRGTTRCAALRAAARRLRSLAAECDRLAERGE